jgi:hypothetical protein
MSDFLGLVQALQMALKAVLMYTESHPRSQSALLALEGAVSRWLQEKPTIHIAASGGKVFLDGALFEGRHVHLANLAKQLNDRQISGFIIKRGVTAEELACILDLLILKPSRIEEAGGPAAVFGRKQTPHIQLSLTQYKEVREGEGGEADKGGPGAKDGGGAPDPAAGAEAAATAAAAMAAMAALMGSPEAAAAAVAAALPPPNTPPPDAQLQPPLPQQPPPGPRFDIDVLVHQWREQFGLIPQPNLIEGSGFAPASLGFLGGTPLSIGLGTGFPPAHQIEGLRRAMKDLTPETLLSIVAGEDTLPRDPSGMRMAFQALSAENFAGAAAGLISGEGPWEGSKEAIFRTLRFAPQRQAMLASLEIELRSQGAPLTTMERFQELIHQLEWENQTMEEKINLTLHHEQLWVLTLGQRLAFLRQLLDEGRTEALLELLDQILDALSKDDASRRERAAQTLTGISQWLLDPGLPMEAEGPLLQGLTAHFAWEPLVHIHKATTEALDVAVGALVLRGEPGQALDLMRELGGLVEFQENRQEWRQTALERLWDRLSDPPLLRKVIELLHTANSETMLNELIPYLESAGPFACGLLVEILGEEPDRKRRARLIEAIRGLGDVALPAVYEGLRSGSWYLVRNTLNLLADMGDAGTLEPVIACLSHRDVRVKRAAVRTLWKIGGPASVDPLLGAIPTMDPETQLEIMFGLGQVRSVACVPILSAFILDKRNPGPVRAKAAETLGQIGDPRAIMPLGEAAIRKGRFFTTAEPTELRVAACRALLAISTPASMELLRNVVATEPWNKERQLLQAVLDERHAT